MHTDVIVMQIIATNEMDLDWRRLEVGKPSYYSQVSHEGHVAITTLGSEKGAVTFGKDTSVMMLILIAAPIWILTP